MMARRVVGAVVAGGGSTRFGGAPKGLERVGGRRIVDRIADALRGVASDLLLVTNAADAARWNTGMTVVRDVRAERGSVVGLHTALVRARTAAVVVAWDMPFVSPELLHLIAVRGQDQSYATLPEGPRGLEPFCALYTPACLPLVEAAIDDGDLRMSSVLARLPSITRISAGDVATIGDPATLFFNVNTPDDLAAAERLNGAIAGSRRR